MTAGFDRTGATDTALAVDGTDPALLLEEAMFTADGVRDPYPYFDRLLQLGQSHVASDGHAFVYGYAPATVTLRSPAFYKGGEHVSSTTLAFTPEQVEQLRRERPDTPGMLSSIDDPDHARLRRLVSVAFTPKAVQHLRQLAHEVFEDVVASFDPHEPVDLLGTLATELPSQVVGALIGLPLADRRAFAELAAVSSVGRDPDGSFEDQLAAVRARREMHEYVDRMIADERHAPGDTLVGKLLRLEAEGTKVTDAEVVSLVALMHSAGYGTTKRLIGNGLVLLLRHPDQADALRVDPSLDRAATDEVLRYDPSVMTVAYFAGEGAEVEGQSLVPGSLCTIVLGAANRDPRVFVAPGAFDVTCGRTAAPLSFGYGAHHCLGAALAKMETDVALGPLLRRYPNMELVAEPQRRPSFRARTYDAVQVVLVPRR